MTSKVLFQQPLRGDPAERVRLAGKDVGLWTNGYDFAASAAQLFGAIDLRGKTLLEIGCGQGVYSAWAAMHGAQRVVGLEPVADGSRSDECLQRFRRLMSTLAVSNVELFPLRFQEYKGEREYFDVVLLKASINHLDEPSTIELHTSITAQRVYEAIFRQLRLMMKAGGKVIIVDSAARNLFADLRIRNPLTPTVNFAKHQSPELWAEIASRCQFRKDSITWLAGKSLRYCGIQKLPPLVSYLGSSVFRLEMTATAFPED